MKALRKILLLVWGIFILAVLIVLTLGRTAMNIVTFGRCQLGWPLPTKGFRGIRVGAA